MTNLKTTFEDTLRPGDVIAISMGHYSHWAIVSDRRCALGRPMLISATMRRGTVQEEPYNTVVSGRTVGHAPVQPKLATYQILANARSQIGTWQYRMFSSNCEHLANWVCGLKVSSSQVNNGLAGAVCGFATTKLITDNPKLLTFVAAGFFGAALGVALTQSHKQVD